MINYQINKTVLPVFRGKFGAKMGGFQKENAMLCTVIDIRGDYAFIKYDDTGVVSEVAIALLPFGVDVGDRLKFENYEFSTL